MMAANTTVGIMQKIPLVLTCHLSPQIGPVQWDYTSLPMRIGCIVEPIVSQQWDTHSSNPHSAGTARFGGSGQWWHCLC